MCVRVCVQLSRGSPLRTPEKQPQRRGLISDNHFSSFSSNLVTKANVSLEHTKLTGTWPVLYLTDTQIQVEALRNALRFCGCFSFVVIIRQNIQINYQLEQIATQDKMWAETSLQQCGEEEGGGGGGLDSTWQQLHSSLAVAVASFQLLLSHCCTKVFYMIINFVGCWGRGIHWYVCHVSRAVCECVCLCVCVGCKRVKLSWVEQARAKTKTKTKAKMLRIVYLRGRGR